MYSLIRVSLAGRVNLVDAARRRRVQDKKWGVPSACVAVRLAIALLTPQRDEVRCGLARRL
jgi:hypothetical protein